MKSKRYPYWDGEKCVSCSVGTSYEEPYFDIEKNKCTSYCYEKVPDTDNVCRPCPAEKPYWDRSSDSCKSCEDLYFGTRPYWSSMFKDCVESCPEGLAPTDGSTICRTCAEIAPETPHWDVYEQKCVMCNRVKLGMICVTCEFSDISRPHWDNAS